MKTHGFTWVGLAIVVLGWGLLVLDLVAGDAVLKAGTLVSTLSLRADVETIAQTAILSGFGLAIMGVLTSGFAAFSRFFDAVLQRSTAPRSPAATRPPEPDRPVMASEPASAAPAVVTPIERVPPPPMPPPLRMKDKNYVILADGSVEVETMFGTRVFATLDEAREFIR